MWPSLGALLPRPKRSELLHYSILDFVQGFRPGHSGITKKMIDAQIELLGSDEFNERENAQKYLTTVAPLAFNELTNATKSAERERASRATDILNNLSSMIKQGFTNDLVASMPPQLVKDILNPQNSDAFPASFIAVIKSAK